MEDRFWGEAVNTTAIVERADFEQLFEALLSRGYEPVGPTVRDQTIVYDRITSVDDLVVGWTDIQEAGAYRLEKRDDEAATTPLGPDYRERLRRRSRKS